MPKQNTKVAKNCTVDSLAKKGAKFLVRYCIVRFAKWMLSELFLK